jgi:hypothetical protein
VPAQANGSRHLNDRTNALTNLVRMEGQEAKRVYDNAGPPAEQIGSFRLAARSAARERARPIRRRERALAEQYLSRLRVGAGWSKGKPPMG